MSKYKHWRALVNDMAGPAAQWRGRIRRLLEHPDFKHIPPSYEAIQDLIDQVERVQDGLRECYRECVDARRAVGKQKLQLRALSARIFKMANQGGSHGHKDR